jgi:hypothetical protein
MIFMELLALTSLAFGHRYLGFELLGLLGELRRWPGVKPLFGFYRSLLLRHELLLSPLQ